MPISQIHCTECGTDFVDARSDVRAGDEAICPRCGAHHVFEAGVPGSDEGLALPRADAKREND
jgi:DNA-directed RNA polymerase subunit RPC12/RpoP